MEVAARGTVFRVNTSGTGFTNLHNFTLPVGITNIDGYTPQELILSGNKLYGTARNGGSLGKGTVFSLNTDGTGFSTLHNFSTLSGPSPSTNSDGATIYAGLILSDSMLYGAAAFGGSFGYGTIFKVNTNGSGFTTLYNFTGGDDGSGPYAGFLLSGSTLYGTTSGSGSSSAGTIFKINTNGTGFTTIYNFTALSGPSSTNSDGANPFCRLILSGSALYGTALNGGISGQGTIFAVSTNGTGFTNLYNFTARITSTNSDGAKPASGLILSNNTLYGTAQNGGKWGKGTVFSFALPRPELAVIRSGANIILTWPTNMGSFDFTGYTLQTTTNFVSTAVWNSVSLAPVIINGQNTVTNPISEIQSYFRLSQ